jgi:hypothetical protein
MNKEKLGQEPAFAVAAFGNGEGIYDSGMSKRFYAACAAMQGLYSNPAMVNYEVEEVIASAYAAADELLKQENE